jgi:hypothetical protein
VEGAFLSESTSGDISNDWQSPDVLVLEPQSNFVSGTVSSGDADLFTLNVPAGLVIIEAHVAFYSFFIPGNLTFIGFQDGSTLLQDPALFTADSSSEISFMLFGQADQGREILGSFSSSPNSSSGTLGEGSYAFWINEVEPQPASYAFEFVTDFAPAPEPGVLAFLALAPVAFLRRRR